LFIVEEMKMKIVVIEGRIRKIQNEVKIKKRESETPSVRKREREREREEASRMERKVYKKR
jgi:hypothetical protein